MEHCNRAYIYDARAIAANIMHERGFRWVAKQIWRGNRDGDALVEAAMRAMMITRGELDLLRPHHLSTPD